MGLHRMYVEVVSVGPSQWRRSCSFLSTISGGGLDWWTGLVDWTGGLDWWTGLVDWTGGLDWWTGLVDWTGGLDWWTDLKNHFYAF